MIWLGVCYPNQQIAASNKSRESSKNLKRATADNLCFVPRSVKRSVMILVNALSKKSRRPPPPHHHHPITNTTSSSNRIAALLYVFRYDLKSMSGLAHHRKVQDVKGGVLTGGGDEPCPPHTPQGT